MIMRQIIFSNGDVAEVSDKSTHLFIIYENVALGNLLALITLSPSVWDSFTMDGTLYNNQIFDHVEYDGRSTVSFALRELTEADASRQALEILLGGAS